MPFDEREITDPSWMRAMAHPLRWRILDVLRASSEPLTATQISDEVGESPANCSFHLRTLAKYGFIEEAGGGKGRSRPWRARDVEIDVVDDPQTDRPSGARAMRDVIRGRAFQAIEVWEQGNTHAYPPVWREAAMTAEWQLKLTVEDLAQIQLEFKSILDRYRSRDRAPEDAVPAKVLAWAFPIGPPPESAPPAKLPTSRRTYLRSTRRHSSDQDAGNE